MWNVEDVTTEEQRQRRIRNRSSWRRHSYATYGVKVVRKCGTEGIEKQKVEEQRE